MSSCLRTTSEHVSSLKYESKASPEPGMPLTAIMSRFDPGVFWNFSHVFFTNLSTCSSIVMNVWL
jgi:hypothetical protein